MRSCLRSATVLLLGAVLWLLPGCVVCPEPGGQRFAIRNPYAGVDWARDGRYKASLHVHTTGSDGSLAPHGAIDRYRDHGYSVVALTDHDVVTYPWEGLAGIVPHDGARKRLADGKLESADLAYQNRDPAALGMVAIEGCELSRHHHMCSYFNDHAGSTNEKKSLTIVAEKGGIAMLNHPGRHQKPVDWYVDLYRTFPVLFGLEVYNQGDRYPCDRETWDAILTRLMPGRPVWGHSNDDMHTGAHLGRNWSVFLLPKLSAEWMRRGMVEGRSYYVYAPAGHAGPRPPAIDAVVVNQRAGTIEIRATDCTNMVWISEGRVVHQGDRLVLPEMKGLGAYVRAELFGVSNTVAGTQPFGLVRR